MKITDIRKLSDKEMEKSLAEKRAELDQFRFDVTGSRSKDAKVGAKAKKTVARLLTEMRARSAN